MTSGTPRLFLDLGNVLVRFDHAHACAAIAGIAGCEVAAVRHLIFESGLNDRFDAGALTSSEFSEAVCRGVGLDDSRSAEVLHAWCDIFTREEENIALAASACEQASVSLASNTNEAHLGFLQRLVPELAGFDAVAASFELGVRKPDRKYYEAALALSATAPSDALLVDDSRINIEAALAMGMNAIQHSPGDLLHDTLVRAGWM